MTFAIVILAAVLSVDRRTAVLHGGHWHIAGPDHAPGPNGVVELAAADGRRPHLRTRRRLGRACGRPRPAVSARTSVIAIELSPLPWLFLEGANSPLSSAQPGDPAREFSPRTDRRRQDWSPATCFRAACGRCGPNSERELPSGALIVSNTFRNPGLARDQGSGAPKDQFRFNGFSLQTAIKSNRYHRFFVSQYRSSTCPAEQDHQAMSRISRICVSRLQRPRVCPGHEILEASLRDLIELLFLDTNVAQAASADPGARRDRAHGIGRLVAPA